jgi:hypothetical protein
VTLRAAVWACARSRTSPRLPAARYPCGSGPYLSACRESRNSSVPEHPVGLIVCGGDVVTVGIGLAKNLKRALEGGELGKLVLNYTGAGRTPQTGTLQTSTRYSYGSTARPFSGCHSKWSCGPLEWPVDPTYPMTSPVSTGPRLPSRDRCALYT